MMSWFYKSIERKGCRIITINYPTYIFFFLALRFRHSRLLKIVKDMGKYLVEQNLSISHQSEMSFTQDRPSTDDLPLLASDRSRDSSLPAGVFCAQQLHNNFVRLKSSLKAGHLLMTCHYWLPTDLVFPVRPLALFVLNKAIEEKKKSIDSPE